MQPSSVREASRDSGQDFPFIIASTPPDAAHRRLVALVIVALAVGIAVAVLYGRVQGPRIDAFIPVIQTVMCVADLVTATLLFAQYSIRAERALLVLASGYVGSGTFAFLQTLAFPGAYAPAGLFGNADQAAWFFVLWHTTFPFSMIVYAFMKGRTEATVARRRSTGFTIAMTLGCVFAAIAGLSLLVTAGVGLLPVLYTKGILVQTPAAKAVNTMMWIIGAAALVVMIVRRRSILDLWLIVTLIAWMPNFIVAVFADTVRFSLGWYMARCYALFASCTLLAVLLTETTFLYARLVSALTLLLRERSNRLMSLDAATSAMAHELKQPLTAITASGEAALIWLQRQPANIERSQACISMMVNSAHRADSFIAGVRELFKDRSDHRTTVHVEDVGRQALYMLDQDLHQNGVRVETDFQAYLPSVRADRTQLQQVILNLVRNAIEAMATGPAGARRLRLAAQKNGGSSVVLTVQDSGPGMTAAAAERLFAPFFTTKAAGMGLGLSICQAIVREHGGDLRLARTDSSGCVFEVELPAAGPDQDRR